MGTASITLVGTLIADPETRKTGKGTVICTFKLPTHEGWGDNQVTTWWRCTLFGKQAEQAADKLKQGSNVVVMGEPKLTEWQGRDGDTRYSAEVICQAWRYGPKSAAGDNRSASRSKGRGKPVYSSDYAADEASLEDLPF